MSKRELVMIRRAHSLVPYGNAELEAFEEQMTTTKPVMVTIHRARNPLQHAKLWAIAAKVADHSEDFHDAEDAIEWAKVHITNMRSYRQLLDGSVIVSTKSISFASMDQTAFERFYDRCLFLWAKKIGCDPETLLRETEAA